MTELILGSRRSGKTLELIKRSARDGIYILTTTKQRAGELFRYAQSIGFDIPFPVTLEDFHRTRFHGSCIERDGLYIDQADDIIHQMFSGINLKAVTWTKYEFTDLDVVDKKIAWPKENPFIEEDNK
jgi:hypothetical protein